MSAVARTKTLVMHPRIRERTVSFDEIPTVRVAALGADVGATGAGIRDDLEQVRRVSLVRETPSHGHHTVVVRPAPARRAASVALFLVASAASFVVGVLGSQLVEIGPSTATLAATTGAPHTRAATFDGARGVVVHAASTKRARPAPSALRAPPPPARDDLETAFRSDP